MVALTSLLLSELLRNVSTTPATCEGSRCAHSGCSTIIICNGYNGYISDIPTEYYCSHTCYAEEDPSQVVDRTGDSDEESEDPSDDEYDPFHCSECNCDAHECECMSEEMQSWIDYILDEDYDY
jgi:hypothetical protein